MSGFLHTGMFLHSTIYNLRTLNSSEVFGIFVKGIYLAYFCAFGGGQIMHIKIINCNNIYLRHIDGD